MSVFTIGRCRAPRRRVWRAREASGDKGSLRGSFARVVLPLTALLCVLIAAAVYRRVVGPPFFLAVAAPLLIALAAIRMTVYGLRRLFHAQSWVPTSERAIAFAIWALVILYFLGLLPEIAAALDDIQIPIGRTRTSLLSIGTAILVVVFTLIVTLWISGLIEQRLVKATHFDVNLRSIMSAGEAVGTTVFDWTREALGVTINEMFGQTEMNYIVGNSAGQWPAKTPRC